MAGADSSAGREDALARLQGENELLRGRLADAERYTAQTLARATRLSQVIAVLGQHSDLDTLVERAALEVADLFAADVGLFMLGPDHALNVEGESGMRPADVPQGRFAIDGLGALTAQEPVTFGEAAGAILPSWLDAYGPKHVAWARLMVGDESLGLMLLVRRIDEPFERVDGNELRAIAYRVALAIENGLLHRETQDRLVRLNRMQIISTKLAGTLELETVGWIVADMFTSELRVAASKVLIDRDGKILTLARAGLDPNDMPDDDSRWEMLPLETTGEPVGWIALAGMPPRGSEDHDLLLHMANISALALDKALAYDRSQEQARTDSLTGLLGHRVFHEVLGKKTADGEKFSLVLLDIDDFKQINDLYGHQVGDETLRLVADALRVGLRSEDGLFRVGGEEFCAVLPSLGHEAAYEVAERLRAGVASIVSGLPVTVSLGVATHPEDGVHRDELLAQADAALHSAKRTGKNRTSVAGEHVSLTALDADRHVSLTLLHERDPDTLVHSVEVATLAVDIARHLGVEDDRLGNLRTAAKLHDLGKIGVPHSILSKPWCLDEEEYRIVKTHPIVGAELLRAWGLTEPARFVHEHHEHVDGSGYPAGLKGEKIALESRIIHVADAFIAMTLDRPYRRAMEREEALEELVRHSGTQFDASVVDAVLALEREPVSQP
jgi:diguanylate cyclase (GGDEF)-like protein/putative nucleotidyltransferase with HDIG domain